jgi:hypothetical protein
VQRYAVQQNAAHRCSSSIYAMNIANIDVIMQNMLLLYVLIISNMFKVHNNNFFVFDVQHVQQMMCSVLLCSVMLCSKKKFFRFL